MAVRGVAHSLLAIPLAAEATSATPTADTPGVMLWGSRGGRSRVCISMACACDCAQKTGRGRLINGLVLWPQLLQGRCPRRRGLRVPKSCKRREMSHTAPAAGTGETAEKRGAKEEAVPEKHTTHGPQALTPHTTIHFSAMKLTCILTLTPSHTHLMPLPPVCLRGWPAGEQQTHPRLS